MYRVFTTCNASCYHDYRAYVELTKCGHRVFGV